MIKEIFNVEGPVVGFLDKAGQLIVLSVLWLLGCVPLITLRTSTTALYYAVIKSVRRGQGSAVREFCRSYRSNLVRGICVTLTEGILMGLVLTCLRSQKLLAGAALVAGIVLSLTGMFLSPVLSRFSVSCVRVWKLSFAMAFRFPHYALLLLAGTVLTVLLQLSVLPIPTILLLPGVWCWLTTFPVEKVLLRFMPEKQENDNAWYYET